jgi:uncharacterized membrane protein YfcA
VSPIEIVLAVAVGLAAGVLSGLFGVGGGIVMTPGIEVVLATPGIVALATPLPVILPTAVTGALTYARAGQLERRGAVLMAIAGVPAAALGAWLTEFVRTPVLLIVTAALLGWQAAGLLRGRRPDAPRAAADEPRGRVAAFLGIGAAAGVVSGLLGVGGGIVMVPLMAGPLRIPLKRALGTSLAAIAAMVIPGTLVHAALGNVDWGIFAAVTIGAIPGARVGARLALGTAERTLRLAVGSFMLLVAIGYGLRQLLALAGG